MIVMTLTTDGMDGWTDGCLIPTDLLTLIYMYICNDAINHARRLGGWMNSHHCDLNVVATRHAMVWSGREELTD